MGILVHKIGRKKILCCHFYFLGCKHDVGIECEVAMTEVDCYDAPTTLVSKDQEKGTTRKSFFLKNIYIYIYICIYTFTFKGVPTM